MSDVTIKKYSYSGLYLKQASKKSEVGSKVSPIVRLYCSEVSKLVKLIVSLNTYSISNNEHHSESEDDEGFASVESHGDRVDSERGEN